MSPINFFLNLKLRVKLLLAFGSLIALTITLVFIFANVMQRMDTYEQFTERVDEITISIHELDAALNYFVFEGFKEDMFQLNHKSNYLDIVNSRIMQIDERLTSLESNRGLTDSLRQKLRSLEEHTKTMVYVFASRGFKDYGLEGQLRESIHKVEKSTYTYSKADMLTLRRHEKDFFLRKDLKYQNDFNNKAVAFIVSIESETHSIPQKEIIDHLTKYQNLFNEVVTLDQQIGLKENEGLKGQVKKDLKSLKTSIDYLRSTIKEHRNQFRTESLSLLVILFITQVALSVFLAIVYSDVITRAVKELQRGLNSLSEGEFPASLKVRGLDEIGKIKTAFNQLLERMKAATHFAEELGSGNLTKVYPGGFKKDVLAHSLIKMQSELEQSNVRQQVTNWSNAGMAKLNEILKNENQELQFLADRVLHFLVTYLKMNQGALYLLESRPTPMLNRIATFAYGKKRFENQQFAVGEGLAGECARDKSMIILTDIPKDYVKITSGLGESVPRFIILLPLKIRNNITGVIELASFKKLETHEINFLEHISENIAALVFNRKAAEENQRILSDYSQRAKEMAEKEEEWCREVDSLRLQLEKADREKTELQMGLTRDVEKSQMQLV